MGLWQTPEQARRWASEDFNLEAGPLIERAVQGANDAFQTAVEAPGRALAAFSVPSLESLTSGWAAPPAASAPPLAANAPPPDGRQGSPLAAFSVPSLESLTSGFGRPAEPTAPGGPPAAQGAPSSVVSSSWLRSSSPSPPSGASPSGFVPPSGISAGLGPAPVAPSSSVPSAPAGTGVAPARGSDLQAFARGVAEQYGIDPDIFHKQITQESNWNPRAQSGAGAAGLGQFMPATAAEYGLTDRFDPYASLDAAARHMRDLLRANGNDYRMALAAYNAGQGNVNRYGSGVFDADFAKGQTRDYVNIILGAGAAAGGPVLGAAAAAARPVAAGLTSAARPSPGPAFGTYTPESLTPNQFTEGQAQGLSPAEALAVCGPAAAVAFARANGRTPTLREAKELAQNLGVWDVDAGMHGPASQVTLLEKMGVPARLAQGTDWNAVRAEVEAGRPVIVDTPMHYYTVTGYDPQTGQFEFGASAGVLRRSGGRTRYRPDELPSLGMGAPRATIFMGAGG